MKTKFVYYVFLFIFLSNVTVYSFNYQQYYYDEKTLGEVFKPVEKPDGPVGSITIPGPGISPKGSKSVGTGFGYVKIGDVKVYQFPISFSYSTRDNMSVSVALPYVKLDIDNYGTEKGDGDFYFGIKTALYNDEVKAAFSLGIVFPSGDKKIMGTSNDYDVLFDIPVQKQIKQYMLNFNIGMAISDIETHLEDKTYKFGVGISRSITKNIGGSLEFNYKDNDTKSSLLGSIGIKYVDGTNSYTLSMGNGLHSNGIDFLLSLGYSKSF